MGDGLKRVAKLCGGIKATSGGKTVEYTATGRIKKPKKVYVDPRTIPLENDQIQAINKIFHDVFGERLEDKAARLLKSAGFTSDDIQRFERTATGQMVNSCWTTNTYAVLHTQEIIERDNQAGRVR